MYEVAIGLYYLVMKTGKNNKCNNTYITTY